MAGIMTTFVLSAAFVIATVNADAPMFTAPATPAQVIPVPETTAVGSSVYRMVAIDNDDDTLIYSLNAQEPPTPVMFKLDPKSGIITTTGPFDFDIPNAVTSYTLTMLVSDGSIAEETSLIMRIMDENDNAPIFQHQAIIRENVPTGTIVASLQASDLDSSNNGLVKYEVIGGDTKGHFEIDSSSGILFTLTTLDYDAVSQYKLVVRAVDHGTIPQAASVTVTVSVMEVLGNGITVVPRAMTLMPILVGSVLSELI